MSLVFTLTNCAYFLSVSADTVILDWKLSQMSEHRWKYYKVHVFSQLCF